MNLTKNTTLMNSEIKAVLILGLIFSLILGFPHIYMIYKNSYALYEPLSLQNVNPLTLDENLYSSDIQEVMNGNFKLSNAQLTNRSDLPSAQMNYFSFYILGFLGYLFGSSIKNLQIISDFLFPFILFLLFYLFLKALHFRKRIILLTISVLMLASLNPFALWELIKSFFSNHLIRPLEFSRLISPELVLIILLIALILLYCALSKKELKYFIFTGIVGGLLFYTYFYFASFFWAGFFFMMAITFFQKDYSTFKKMVLSAFIGGLISIFFIINLFKLRALSYYPEIALRIGAEFPPMFSLWHIIFTIIILIAIMSLWLIPKREKKCSVDFLTAFLFGSIICINLHLLLGYTLLYLHWWDRIIAPFIFISLIFCLQSLIYDHFPKNYFSVFIRRMIPFLCILLLFFGVYHQISFSVNMSNYYTISPQELELYDWLNENTPKDSTVLTLSIASNFNLASHTHNNIYLPHSFLTTIPKEEIIDRFLFASSMFNLPSDELKKRLDSDNLITDGYDQMVYEKLNTSQELFEVAYFNYYLFHEEYDYHKYKLDYYPSELSQNYTGFYLPQKLRSEMMSKYFANNFIVYEYDYILVGPYEKQFINLNTNPTFASQKPIFINQDYSLYSW